MELMLRTMAHVNPNDPIKANWDNTGDWIQGCTDAMHAKGYRP
jgi:hypothetical protein